MRLLVGLVGDVGIDTLQPTVSGNLGSDHGQDGGDGDEKLHDWCVVEGVLGSGKCVVVRMKESWKCLAS